MAQLDYNYIADLVRDAQAGDSNAFAEMYAATYPGQYRYACGYLRDPELAQDAIQETYILVLKNIHKLRDPMLFAAWLNQITFRVCYRMQALEARRRRMETGEDEAAPGGFDPEAQVVDVDSKQYLIRQIMSLPFTEAQVIILRYYRSMKLEDIAQLMKISLSSVKRYLASGCRRLQETVEL